MTAATDGRLGAALAEWLPGQRWFADKDRRIDRVLVDRVHPLTASGVLALATVVFTDGAARRYQVPLGFGGPAAEVIGTLDGIAVFDATADPDLMTALLGELADGRLGSAYGSALRDALDAGELPVRRQPGEQSNTSVVFGERFILKLFRTLAAGVNPELEVQRALRGHPHVAELTGAIETEFAGDSLTLGLVQEFLPGAVDGWSMVTAGLAAGDPGLNARLRALGAAVARVHAALAEAFGTALVTPALAEQACADMADRLSAMSRPAPELAGCQDALRAVFEPVRRPAGEVVHRVHGDLHLGQVLWSAGRWRLIDFEGEPTLPVRARRAWQSPLRDIAGLLRSLEYAAETAGPDVADGLAEAREAVLAGYQDVSAAAVSVPVLRAYELDRAIYEVGYEIRNRPDRVGTPLRAVCEFAAGMR